MSTAAAPPLVPSSPPDIGSAEIDEVVRTLESGWLTTGPRVRQCRAALTVNLDQPDAPDRIADLVRRLLQRPALQRELSRNAQRLVDRRGTARVVRRLRQLRRRHQGDAFHAVA